MQRNKPGLADLKKLRQQQEQPSEPAPVPTKPVRAARKRSPFLPPSPAVSGQTAAPRHGTGQDPAHLPPGGKPGNRSTPGASPQSTAASAADAAARLSTADRSLFHQAVRYVEKIKDPGRVLLSPRAVAHPAILEERRLRAAGLERRPPGRQQTASGDAVGQTPEPEQRKARPLSDSFAPVAHDQDGRHYLKPGHGTDILKDLKRGKWPIGASLDLHGSTLEDARERFERFLSSCLTHDVKCVRIVHGKGYGSPNGDAVLKTTVRRWLTQIVEVIAYVECAEADGGSGAVQVLLK